MDLAEKLDEVVKVMKGTKEQWVATNPESTDLAIYVHFYRDDDLIATLQCPLDRDTALRAARLGASGFNATTVSMTFESYTTQVKESPITGKPWMPREMQYVAETHPDAFKNGWILECLTTSIHQRGGESALYAQPYQIVDGVLQWKDPKTASPTGEQGVGGGGYMFDILQESMRLPTMTDHLEKEAKENPLAALVNNLIEDPERRQFHIDMATAKALEENDLVVGVMLMAEEGTERQQWLEERLGGEGWESPFTTERKE